MTLSLAFSAAVFFAGAPSSVQGGVDSAARAAVSPGVLRVDSGLQAGIRTGSPNVDVFRMGKGITSEAGAKDPLLIAHRGRAYSSGPHFEAGIDLSWVLWIALPVVVIVPTTYVVVIH